MTTLPRHARVIASFVPSIAVACVLAHCQGDDFVARAGGDTDAASDASAQGDVGTDAGMDGVAAGFCSSGDHLLCADFEGEDPLGGWVRNQQQSGDAVVDQKDSVSPPSSVIFTLGSSDRPIATRLKNLSRSTSHLSCRFSVRPNLVTAGPADIYLVTFEAKAPTLTEYYVAFAISENRTFLTERGFLRGEDINQTIPLHSSIPRGQWSEVAVDIRLGQTAQASEVSIMFQGTRVGTSSLNADVGMFDSISIGAHPSNDVNGDTEVRYDDIVCDEVP